MDRFALRLPRCRRRPGTSQPRRTAETFADKADGFITHNHVDPTPVGGMFYGEPSSLPGCPVLNLPLLSTDDMPMAVQVMGYFREDRRIVATAHWPVHAVRCIDTPN